jgi:DNA modification methylase
MKDGFDLKVLDLLIPKMKKVNMYIYCSKYQVQMILEYFKKKNCNFDILVWHKQNPSPLTNNIYLNDLEYVLFFREKGVKLYGNYHTKKKCYISGTNQLDKKKWLHPTIKPLPFIENHIINSSKEGDVVLDMFAGSGTTLVGAINTKRQFIGFEKDAKYYEIANRRIAEAICGKEKKIEENR